MNPRCPECDIELDCSSDQWVCPLCGQTPRPEQYVHSPLLAIIDSDPIALRDLATALAAFIEEIVTVEPELAPILSKAYHIAQTVAEHADQEGHQATTPPAASAQ